MTMLRKQLGKQDIKFLLPCPSRGMTGSLVIALHYPHISTPMPLAGHDAVRCIVLNLFSTFLLPCPSRGMTMSQHICIMLNLFLLPCPSRGMTITHLCMLSFYAISTPMPLAGHDVSFLYMGVHIHISTPMPLAGHDDVVADVFHPMINFYSHAPRGA